MNDNIGSLSADKLRLLIVEDHTSLAENLFEYLGEDKYILDFAADGLTGLHLATTNTYDVIILDVMLPGIDGTHICRRLRNDLKSDVPILLLTAKDALEDKETGFESGADDYLTKPFDMRELELRIAALSRRTRPIQHALSAKDICYFPGTLLVQTDEGKTVKLSGIGASLFEILMRAYPNYVKHKTLYDLVWNDSFVDPHTLRSHISALRKNLKSGIGRVLVQSVHGKGYCINPDSEN